MWGHYYFTFVGNIFDAFEIVFLILGATCLGVAFMLIIDWVVEAYRH